MGSKSASKIPPAPKLHTQNRQKSPRPKSARCVKRANPHFGHDGMFCYLWASFLYIINCVVARFEKCGIVHLLHKHNRVQQKQLQPSTDVSQYCSLYSIMFETSHPIVWHGHHVSRPAYIWHIISQTSHIPVSIYFYSMNFMCKWVWQYAVWFVQLSSLTSVTSTASSMDEGWA